MGAGHQHGDAQRDRQRRALWWSFGANGVLLVAEVIGGLMFSSLALLADAAHLSSDVAGLAVALVAQTLMARPSSDRHTYGWQRAEVLGAQANAVILVAASGWIIYAAVGRLGTEVEVEGGGLVIVALIGLLVNLGSLVALVRAQGQSLNMRAAVVHMAADAAGSVAALAAGVAIVVAGASWVDPVASIAIAVLVLWSAWGLLRDTSRVLLEAAPPGLSADQVTAAITAEPGIEAVHHVHLWSLASDAPALSAHLMVTTDLTLHDAQDIGDRVRHMLADRFDIGHATFELECHPCDPSEAGLAGHGSDPI